MLQVLLLDSSILFIQTALDPIFEWKQAVYIRGGLCFHPRIRKHL